MNLSRRAFIKTVCWSTAAAGAGAAYPALIEPHRVQINHLTIPVRQLPRALDGLTIAHLTDLHCSRYVSAAYLTDCIELANSLAPDLIVFTGDYVTSNNHFGPLGRLMLGNHNDQLGWAHDVATCLGRARARHGVFACLGNHDYWFNADAITHHLQNRGITVLRNNSATIAIRDTAVPIVGLGDLWTERIDMNRAFAGINHPFAIVLMHNPDFFPQWPRPGPHLILAGHTHGGQVNLPCAGPPRVPSRYGQKYAHGHFQNGDTHMYVSRGVGVIFPPVRLNCRPEIAVLHLKAAPLPQPEGNPPLA